MLLIDALYINVGGGKVLLNYLISELEKTDYPVHYLLDERIREQHPKVKKSNQVLCLVAGIKSRKQFYKLNKNAFSKVLCFGNIPPPIKGAFTAYTYFHNLILLDIPKEFSFFSRIKFQLKIAVIKSLRRNTDYWWVQTENVQKILALKYKESVNRIQLKPFYPPFVKQSLDQINREPASFLYVSNATPNKNHQRLLEAFCKFYDHNKKGTLILTVNNHYPVIKKIIQQKLDLGYPIKNVGFVDRNELVQLYKKAEYLIYPSVNESFGLGLVEAIECGCKVIGADLPYTHAVCVPSFVFDPFEVTSIEGAFARATSEEFSKGISLVSNHIEEVVAELTK